MTFRLFLAALAFATGLTGAALANPGAPSFGPALYGDGEIWGTKGAAILPPPNEHNLSRSTSCSLLSTVPPANSLWQRRRPASRSSTAADGSRRR